MKPRPTLSLTIALLASLVAGCHGSGGTSGPSGEGNAPGLKSIAASAMNKARHWHSDAILVNLEVRNDGAQSQKIFEFYAPSDMSGYSVTTGMGPESDQALNSVSWGTQAIPLEFPDLSEAVDAMRARGMKGGVGGATLTAVKLCGFMTVMRWELLPRNADQPDIKSYDVYFYADPASGERPMDWHEADDLADKSLKGDRSAWASLTQAAQTGDPNAATNVGYVYGIGAPMAPKNFAQAGPWFCAAAFEGSPAAQFDLGLMFENGWGVGPSSIDTSGILYYPAAVQGLPEAQLNFGARVWRVRAGSDIRKAGENASQWWQKADAQGLDAGNKNIAAIHSWNSQQIPFNMVPLIESTVFIEARNWNPAAKGTIAGTAADYPERFPPNGWPEE